MAAAAAAAANSPWMQHHVARSSLRSSSHNDRLAVLPPQARPCLRPALYSSPTARAVLRTADPKSARPRRPLSSPLRAAVCSPAPSKATAEGLLDWLLFNQGSTPSPLKVELLGEGESRGLVAAGEVGGDEVLLSVPLRAVFADPDPRGEGPDGGLPWVARMAMDLLRARAGREDAPGGLDWTPWIEALPEAVPLPLVSYTDEELEQVQDPDTLAEARGMRAMHAQCWEVLGPEVESLGFGFPEWEWALSVLYSRCFCFGEDAVHMTVPGVDMCNHVLEPNCSVRCTYSPEACQGVGAAEEVVAPEHMADGGADGGGRFELYAGPEGLAPGEEVTISYGSWPNDVFFLFFGFVPPPGANPNDSVVLFPTPAEAVATWNALLEAQGAPGLLGAEAEAGVDASVGGAFQRVVLTASGLDGRIVAAHEWLAGASAAAGVESPPPLGELVAARCRVLLAGFPTTLEEDEAMLAREEGGVPEKGGLRLEGNAATTVRYRYGKKSVLAAGAGLVVGS